jgi:hypothetical protein
MKKLKHIKTFPDTFPVERKVHRHIPLDVGIQKELRPHPQYWRLVDPKFNLIEVGLETSPAGWCHLRSRITTDQSSHSLW